MDNRWIGSRVLWGGLLLAAGILFLLQNLGVIQFAEIIWGVFLGIMGIFFLSFFFTNRENWWALIPGIILIVLGLMIALDTLIPDFAGSLGGALLLGGIGLSFWIIYLLRRDFWWAIIPGGVMFTLVAVVILSSMESGVVSDEATGGIFFLGLGLTFGLVGLVPTPEGRMKWAWFPAGILTLMGLLIIGAAENLLAYLVPAGLILAGLFLIYRTVLRRRA